MDGDNDRRGHRDEVACSHCSESEAAGIKPTLPPSIPPDFSSPRLHGADRRMQIRRATAETEVEQTHQCDPDRCVGDQAADAFEGRIAVHQGASGKSGRTLCLGRLIL